MTQFNPFPSVTGSSSSEKYNWQEKLQTPSFKSVQFFVADSTTDFGRRIAYHEFPQYDSPYAEDLGRKGRRFTINAFVVGPNWEKQRDDLIKACESKGSGILIHPDLPGDLEVMCESCSVSESKVNAAMTANFTLTFVETKPKKKIQKNKKSTLLIKKPASISLLARAFALVQDISKLPQYAADYLFSVVGDITGISNPFALINSLDSLKNLMNGDVTLPWQFAALLTSYTNTFNNDYGSNGTILEMYDKATNEAVMQTQATVIKTTFDFRPVTPDDNNQTNTVTPRTATQQYLAMATQPVNYCAQNTPNRVLQYQAGIQMELFIKSVCLAEAIAATTETTFESLQEAQELWTQITTAFDTLITLAAKNEYVPFYTELKVQRALFQADIQERAPYLTQMVYKKIDTPMPSLLIAYEEYEDLTRAEEIVTRNKVKDPAFITSNKLELLSE